MDVVYNTETVFAVCIKFLVRNSSLSSGISIYSNTLVTRLVYVEGHFLFFLLFSLCNHWWPRRSKYRPLKMW